MSTDDWSWPADRRHRPVPPQAVIRDGTCARAACQREVALLADLVRLRRPGQREGLDLDHQLALLGAARRFRPAPAWRSANASGELDAGVTEVEVGDGDHLGRLGHQADQVPSGDLPATSNTASHPIRRDRPDPLDEAVAVQHRGRPDLPQVVLVRLAGGRDHGGAAGERRSVRPPRRHRRRRRRSALCCRR